MNKYTYSIEINKPVDLVYKKMTDKSIYADWAKAWGEGMTYKGEYVEGGHLIFHDNEGGTKALVEELKENAHIKMKHVGMANAKGEDIELSDDVMKAWVGSLEEYYFTAIDENTTKVEVVMVIDDQFKEMSEGAWPKALELLKGLCESA